MFDSGLVFEWPAAGVGSCPGPGVDLGPGSGSGSGLIDLRLGELVRVWWLGSRPGWVDPGWYGVPVRSDVAALMDFPAGSGLVAALERLPSLVPCPFPHGGEGGVWSGGPPPGSGSGVLCACQVVVAAAWEAVSSWVQARGSAVVVDLAGVDPVEVEVDPGSLRAGRVVDPVREELAAAWRVSPQSAACRIESARRLAELPGLRELASDGVVGWSGVRGVESLVRELGPDEARVAVGLLVSRVRARIGLGLRPWTALEVRQAARRIVARSGTPRERRVRAGRECGVWLQPISEHLSELVAVLPGERAHVVYRRISNLARDVQQGDCSDSGGFADSGAGAASGAGPRRSLDNIRADVLVDLLLGEHHGTDSGADLDSGPGSGRLAVGVRVGVTVPLGSLLGLVDEPGELAGYGPIPAEVARELAADGSWRLWVTDPGARVVATGCRTYRPSVGLARLVRARLPYCRFPGCRRPSIDCDLDHVVAWPEGLTEVDNLGPLCRRHHNLKTHAGWRIEVHEDGSWSWASPTGTTHHDHPPSVNDTG